jgi:hypothetical protein
MAIFLEMSDEDVVIEAIRQMPEVATLDQQLPDILSRFPAASARGDSHDLAWMEHAARRKSLQLKR